MSSTKWGVREQNKDGIRFYSTEEEAKQGAAQWTRDTKVTTIVSEWHESGADNYIHLVCTYKVGPAPAVVDIKTIYV